MKIKILLLVIAFCVIYLPTSTTTYSQPVRTLDSEIERLSIKYEVNADTVRAIVSCESQMYGNAENKNIDENGKVWSVDKGYLQVNSYYHTKPMQKLGLDINDKWDSLEYGFILMKNEGFGPWKASRKCWLTKIQASI